jgi:hypothetical protein
MFPNVRKRVMDSWIGLEASSSYENECFQFISMKGKLGMLIAAVSPRGLSALLLGYDREELERSSTRVSRRAAGQRRLRARRHRFEHRQFYRRSSHRR